MRLTQESAAVILEAVGYKPFDTKEDSCVHAYKNAEHPERYIRLICIGNEANVNVAWLHTSLFEAGEYWPYPTAEGFRHRFLCRNPGACIGCDC